MEDDFGDKNLRNSKSLLGVLKAKDQEVYAKSLLDASLEKLQQEAKKAKYEAGVAELTYNLNKREEDKHITSDRQNRVYRFVYPVIEQSVADCMNVLTRWSRLTPGCDMEIVFCSPGGDMVNGFALFDFIQDLRRQGHKITTKTIGYAASMAGVLLQAGDDRIMGKEAWLLIHEGSFNASGSVGNVEDTVQWVKKIGEHVVDIFAKRAVPVTKKTHKEMVNIIKKNWKRTDWWLSAQEALELGFCDKIE